MLPVWLEVILAWLALGWLLNAVGFVKLYRNFLNKAASLEKYNEGYKDSMHNIRTHCKVQGEFPSEKWILSTMNKRIETKEDLMEHGVENLDHRSINNYYFR